MMDILILGGNLEMKNIIYQLSIFLIILGVCIALIPFFVKLNKDFCKYCLYSIGVATALFGTTFFEIRTTTLNHESSSVKMVYKNIFEEKNMEYDLNEVDLFVVEKNKTSSGLDVFLVSMKMDDVFIPIQEIRQNQTGLAKDDTDLLNTWLKKYGKDSKI